MNAVFYRFVGAETIDVGVGKGGVVHWRLQRAHARLRHGWARACEVLRRGVWRARAARWPRLADGRVLFHVGCGDIDAPGFINIDARPAPHVHLVTRRLERLRAVPGNTADLVYMCHVLEHVPRAEVMRVVREMYRILKPGGVLRLSVPDFDRLIALYRDSGGDLEQVAPPLFGGQDYPQNFHLSVFNTRYLTGLLALGGFVQVHPWDPDTVEHHGFEDWASRPLQLEGRAFPISLNLEALKPAAPPG